MRLFVLGLAILLVLAASAHADGGRVCVSKQIDGYRITVFIAPASPRAGPVDFSVLVQAADSEAPLLDVPVTIFVYPEKQPQRRLGGPATSAAATNKLFRAIQLEMPEPGTWHVEVEVDAPARPLRVDGDLALGPPLPSWMELAPWIGWPALAILLFAVHQGLVRRHRAAWLEDTE